MASDATTKAHETSRVSRIKEVNALSFLRALINNQTAVEGYRDTSNLYLVEARQMLLGVLRDAGIMLGEYTYIPYISFVMIQGDCFK